MADYGRMDPFSFAGSKEVDHPVSIRMYVARLPISPSCSSTGRAIDGADLS